jgi:SAM-dependent methyltransferase
MALSDTDRAWQRYGAEDPYFGVLSHPRFRDAARDGPVRQEFFRTGEEHVEKVFKIIAEQFRGSTQPQRALDFGCGVGRILLPLARRAREVVGVDVSGAMLDEARRNCEQAGVQNVKLLLADDELSSLDGTFDLIHSYIVFQHITPRRGLLIARRLIGLLVPNGVAVLHFTHGSHSKRQQLIAAVRKHVPLAHGFANVIRGRPWGSPLMQMNSYPLASLCALLQQTGCERVALRFTDHGGYLGVVLFAQRAAAETF